VRSKYVLAIDAGSSGCRAIIFDIQGNLISSAYQEWFYEIPPELAPMGKDLDARKLWGIICKLVRQSIKKAGILPSEIISVSSTSQRQAVLFLDKDGQELYAGPNTDLRALIEGFTIDGEFEEEVYRITGHKPSLLFTPAKLKWFQGNRPQIYERIATVLSLSDWITFKLSGERIAETSSVGDIGLLDISSAKWSGRLSEMLQLPHEIYPSLVWAGTRVGAVTARAAKQTGLVKGTMVVAGGGDTQCGLLGMGLNDEAEVGIVAGWSGTLQMIVSRPVIDAWRRTWTGCHIVQGKWVLESNAQESGGAYRWLKGLLFDKSGKGDKYTLMDILANDVPVGAGGAFAFIGPTKMDMTRMKPSLGGFIFPVTPSVTSIEKRHLIRAALENLAFSFKANCVQLEEITGLKLRKIALGGGLSKSNSLVRILSNVLNMPVTCFESHEVTASGAAMCAATGAGIYPDLIEAMKRMRPESRVVEPDSQATQEYRPIYEKWLYTMKWLDELLDKIG
jgi:sugar (pentulose or hexulose) kinase